MDAALLRRFGFVALIVAGCAQPGPSDSTGIGGSHGSGGAGQGASGGETGTGTGGATGQGGTPAGTGGVTQGGSGGATGTGMGGATGTGTGGATGTGMGGATGTGMGGAKGTGGSGSGTGGSGTGGAMTGTGGSSMSISVAAIVPTLDGYLWIGTCANGTASGLDCPIYDTDTATSCPMPNATDWNMRGAIRTFTHNVGGTTGTQYTINFEVRGVAGTKCYQGGTPASTALIADVEGSTGNNGWYVGGTPIVSLWNTYEIHVNPPVPGAANVYYLNAFPNNSGYCEKHETFVMKYTASFPVLGGGTIETVIHDSNCLGQQNCGAPDAQPTCKSPRTVSLTGMMPQPPASFTQPYTEANGFLPQWLFFDVKTVTSP